MVYKAAAGENMVKIADSHGDHYSYAPRILQKS
jgi:hypothetical protein